MSCSSERLAELGGQRASGTEAIGVSTTTQTRVSAGDTQYSLEIMPTDATRNSTLYLNSKGFGLPDAKVEWLVNGYPAISPTPDQFNTYEARKGDVVKAKATIYGKEVLSNETKIKNSPPEVSKIRSLPEVVKLGDPLSVEVSGVDIDGDDLTFIYEWTKNGKPIGNENQIEVPLKRGDKVSIKVTPYDGEDYGSPVIMQREIHNMPSIIIDEKNFNVDGKVYTYQIKAIDPDGDPLTFSLKQAPKGMTVDKSTGLITWKVEEKDKGKHPVTFQVSDGHGGNVVYNFEIAISVLQ
jgi:3D (Asp-Asp-Asp) domain-containing protein